jgi:hypothetical protein
MRIYFYIGPNKELKSGFSIKFWKIARKGRRVTAKWGPATVDLKKRKVVKASWTQGRDWTLASESEAKAQMKRRIDEQLAQGYHRVPRRRS